jgi:hypothetical protein
VLLWGVELHQLLIGLLLLNVIHVLPKVTRWEYEIDGILTLLLTEVLLEQLGY